MQDLANISAPAVALGLGLLVGMERERHKGQGKERAAQGLRTFALAAVLGEVSVRTGGVTLLAVVVLCVAGLTGVAYYRQHGQDPGLTSEIALLAIVLLGALCNSAPALASGLAVVMVMLLAFRVPLHHFVRDELSEQEVRDSLILLAAALVVLPLAPDRYMGPYAVLNPQTLCRLVVLLMAVAALGHFTVRGLGARYGYALSAIAAGFASSAATVAAMGTKARADDARVRELGAAGLLSNLATLVQVGLIVGVVSPALVVRLAPMLAAGLVTVALYAAGLLLLHRGVAATESAVEASVFDLKKILMISAVITSVTLMCAALLDLLGSRGLMLGALLGGLADAHAPIVSIASLFGGQLLAADQVSLLVLAALTSNSVTKCVLAWIAGGHHYAACLIPGQLLLVAAMWLVVWL